MPLEKILHVNNDNYNLGGAFILTYRLEKYLQKFGFSYDYLTMDHFVIDSANYPIPDNDKTYSANLRKNRLIGHFVLPFYVNNVLKHNDYKIIHIDTDSAWKALLYAVPAHRRGLKVIVHSHAMAIEGDSVCIKKSLEIIAKSILTKYSNRYIACSKMAAEWILPNNSLTKVDIIPNGIEMTDFYFCSEEREEYRRKYKFDKSIVIGNVGVFTKTKNQEYLVLLLDSLLRENYDVKLLLVGNKNTSYGNKIGKMVKDLGLEDKVILTGNTKHVRQFMNAMDVYIQPSLYEGFGLVSVEAQATGLLTLISESLPKETIVSNWAYSFNVSRGQDVVKRVISEYNFSVKERTRKKLNENCGLDAMAKKVSEIYKTLIE